MERKPTLTERKMIALETERAMNIARYLANPADDGRKGRTFEIGCSRKLSNKTTVAAQGRTDVSIKMVKNGRTVYIPAECKTNGGRVTDLLIGENKSPFVIYRLQVVQKHKATKSSPAWDEERNLPALIIPTSLFLQVLEDCKAIKEVAHKGVVDGLAIQCSSKKLYLRLKDYAENYGGSVIFDRDAVYDFAEFDGLEL